MEPEPKKSIYKRAAEWGLPFGLYIACMGVASIYADYFAPLSIIFILMIMATPLVVYYFQRRRFIEDDGFTEYAGLWMLGILLFIFGSVIASFIIYLVLQYFRPDFMYEQARMVINAYSKIPQVSDAAHGGREAAAHAHRSGVQRFLVYHVLRFAGECHHRTDRSAQAPETLTLISTHYM